MNPDLCHSFLQANRTFASMGSVVDLTTQWMNFYPRLYNYMDNSPIIELLKVSIDIRMELSVSVFMCISAFINLVIHYFLNVLCWLKWFVGNPLYILLPVETCSKNIYVTIITLCNSHMYSLLAGYLPDINLFHDSQCIHAEHIKGTERQDT